MHSGLRMLNVQRGLTWCDNKDETFWLRLCCLDAKVVVGGVTAQL